MLKFFKSKNLQSVKHGFFGRSGGVSTGIFSSLNLSEKTADSAVNICANRALVMDELEISNQKVFFPNQQHTNKSVFIDKATDLDNIRHMPADAVITNMDGIGVGILTADCSPILAYESESGFILAIHAGWKGALAGVCENALNSLKDIGVNIKNFSEVQNKVKKIKSLTDLPVVVGFGIKDPLTAKKMSSFSDGIVVGSKIVELVEKN